MKRCWQCLSRTVVKGRCTHCHATDRRKVHTMLNPQVERRGRTYNALDKAIIHREGKG